MNESFEIIAGWSKQVWWILFFVFGALIGSFLNVVIHRVPLEESIVLPDSHCPVCKAKIKFYDNIPVLSWLILGGKCRACRKPIAWRYPLIELLTGLLFTVTFSQQGFTAFLPVSLIFVAIMVALIFIDAEHMILPNALTYPLLALAFLVRLSFPLFGFDIYFPDLTIFPLSLLQVCPKWLISVAAAVLGAIVGGGSLWAVGELWKRLRGVDAMGLGDVKMMLGVGGLLGWHLALLSIFLGAFSGAIVGGIIIARQKDKNLQTMIPFGIFLGTGSIISLLFGEEIINWYLLNFVP